MKDTGTIFRISLMAALSTMIISCSKNYNNNSTSTNADFQTALEMGTWTIGSYIQKTEDKTSQFAGATFTFSKSGTVTVNQNGTVTSGTWSYAPSVAGYYGGPATKASMGLSLGSQSPFDRLSRTWNIESNSSSSISLVNPEPTEDEHVKFSHQ
jgi:hypothetical protein